MAADLPSDERLLADAASGSMAAFASLYQRHQSRVYRFALGLCGNAALAQDVTQETFLALLSRLHRFDSTRGGVLAFLMGIARNLSYQRLRLELPLDEQSEERLASLASPVCALSTFEQASAIEALRRAIAVLPHVYREVLILCDLEELDYAQAAQSLGVRVGTVRSRLHRARGLLLDKWRAMHTLPPVSASPERRSPP